MCVAGFFWWSTHEDSVHTLCANSNHPLDARVINPVFLSGCRHKNKIWFSSFLFSNIFEQQQYYVNSTPVEARARPHATASLIPLPRSTRIASTPPPDAKAFVPNTYSITHHTPVSLVRNVFLKLQLTLFDRSGLRLTRRRFLPHSLSQEFLRPEVSCCRFFLSYFLLPITVV